MTELELMQGLNPQQKAATKQLDGPVLINAGAGSGKTRVLTGRIALLLLKGAEPSRILALTFTKKAAREMKDRIQAMAGDQARYLVMGTFHSVFIGFLRQWAPAIGYPEGFTIYDEEDSRACLKECISTVLFGPDTAKPDKEESARRRAILEHYRPNDIKGIISMAKNNLIGPDAYAADTDRTNLDSYHKRPRTKDIYRAYQQKLFSSGVMDFDDILVNMDSLLAYNRAALDDFCSRFDHILVDEYQDTNLVQYDVLRRMTLRNHNICVVGDDSQSIYAFRGAKLDNILNFQRDYPECRTFRLEVNYRSSADIVNAANRLIAHNTRRLPKQCVSAAGAGEPVEIIEADDEKDEAAFITETVRAGLAAGKTYSDFAVLYRTNAQSRTIEDIFMRNRIPYVIFSGTSFFERAEVRDALSYFKLIVNNNDDEAFKRCVAVPARGFGKTSLDALKEIASKKRLPLFQAARLPDLEALGMKKKAAEAVKAFTDYISGYTKLYPAYAADHLAKEVLESSGLLDHYKADTSEEGRQRVRNLEEVINSVASFAADKLRELRAESGPGEVAVVPSIDVYLEDMTLLSNADTASDTDDKVSLMTAHSSKGLEFPTVFVTGLEEGLFPLCREGQLSEAELEEERRLMYVAMTRAKEKLYVSYTLTRYKYGHSEKNTPSLFLTEIEGEQNDNE